MEVRIECTVAEFERLKAVLPEILEVKIKGPSQPQKSRDEKYPREFEQFWDAYPRKDGKSLAFRAWNARIGEGIGHSTLTACAKNYSDFTKQERTEERFMLQPATFCGPNRRWEDYLSPRVTKPMFSGYVP